MTAKQSILRDLPADIQRDKLPRHVAIIMDGNGRWAKRRGLPRIMGHPRGVDALRDLVRCCDDWGLEALTVFAFSTENWSRPQQEVTIIMTLIEQFLRAELPEMMERDIKLELMGNLQALPRSLQAQMHRSTSATQNNRGLRFVVATNYGGRQEIIQACRELAIQVKQGEIEPEDIDEALFERHLYTAGTCDPDLLIRTSGEMRVSNFLLWQMAYAELYITETLWPDFDRTEFHRALCVYQQRDRRFGRVKNEV